MNLNDNRLIIKTLKSGDQKVFSLVYAGQRIFRVGKLSFKRIA